MFVSKFSNQSRYLGFVCFVKYPGQPGLAMRTPSLAHCYHTMHNLADAPLPVGGEVVQEADASLPVDGEVVQDAVRKRQLTIARASKSGRRAPG